MSVVKNTNLKLRATRNTSTKEYPHAILTLDLHNETDIISYKSNCCIKTFFLNYYTCNRNSTKLLINTLAIRFN